jgi:hypothetical protein
MPLPLTLTAAHMIHALAPATPDEAHGDPRPYLRLGIDRIDSLLEITDAWRNRLPTLPEPPQRQTLSELVQAARRRMREDRMRVDVEELGARRFVLQRVHEELQP